MRVCALNQYFRLNGDWMPEAYILSSIEKNFKELM